MDFEQALSQLKVKIIEKGGVIETEEATKNAFVMPFLIQAMGYDVFDPSEVQPEFTADIGTKKGEKVDYAIMKDGAITLLIECKKYGEKLSSKHASQLFRYFSVTKARIAVLTNGQVYQFYTDLDKPNVMDDKPFLKVDLCDLEDHAVEELRKLTKEHFDISSVLSAAGQLKYLNEIIKVLDKQAKDPDEDFVRLIAQRVYDGQITQKVREQFTGLTKQAFNGYIKARINARLKIAFDGEHEPSSPPIVEMENITEVPEVESQDDVVTTEEEYEGYNIVRAIVREVVPVIRITARDTKSYFGILVDDNNRKPVCRLHFNRAQKYLGLLDSDKNETRHAIESLDDIFNFAEDLKAAASQYVD